MRQEKIQVLDEVQAWVRKSPFVIITDYTGLKVAEFTELRNRLSEVKAEVHVVKNTFLRRAMANESLPELGESDLHGQTAVVVGEADAAAAAKVLKTFGSEFQRPKIRGGVVDKAVLDSRAIMALADLPSREVLLAQLLGLINSPATKLARLIGTPASQLAQVIRANSEKGS